MGLFLFPRANSIINCKNPAVKSSPGGAECLSPLHEHTARTHSCRLAAGPVTSGTAETPSSSVGGQENGWPSIPSTKFTPRLLTAQAVLALNTGVTPTRAFWNTNCLCSLKATLLCPGNTLPIDRVFLWIFLPQHECKSCALLPYFRYPLHKRTSCSTSDLVRVHSTARLHYSTFFSTFSSANIFHDSKPLVLLLGNLILAPPTPPPAIGAHFSRLSMQHQKPFPSWQLHPFCSCTDTYLYKSANLQLLSE